MRMSRVRSSSRSMLTRASARASGAPGQGCAPWPNETWLPAFAPSASNVAGSSKRRGVRIAAAVGDVARELLVQERERVLHERLRGGAADGAGVLAAARAEAFAEEVVVLLGHPEQVGHHEHREGSPVLADVLTVAGQELVD